MTPAHTLIKALLRDRSYVMSHRDPLTPARGRANERRAVGWSESAAVDLLVVRLTLR